MTFHVQKLKVGPLELKIMEQLMAWAADKVRCDLVEVSQHVWNGLLYEKREAVSGHGWDGNIVGIPIELHRELPAAWARGKKSGSLVGIIMFDDDA